MSATAPTRMLMPLTIPGDSATVKALVDGALEFSLPGAVRQPLTKQLAERLFVNLPIAFPPPVPACSPPRGRDEYLRLADRSRAALESLAHEFETFVLAVVRGGVRVHMHVPYSRRDAVVTHVMQGMLSHVPGVWADPLRPMPLEALTASTPDGLFHFFREAAWTACLETAGRCLEAVEKLFLMMAVGLVQFVGRAGARMFFVRGAVKRSGTKAGPKCPTPEASHPFFEHADHATAKVVEAINVAHADHSGIWAKTPDRIRNVLAATPRWLQPDLLGITATAIRVGEGLLDPDRLQAYGSDGVAFMRCSAVILMNQFVLGLWDEGETPSLLKLLFGIG